MQHPLWRGIHLSALGGAADALTPLDPAAPCAALAALYRAHGRLLRRLERCPACRAPEHLDAIVELHLWDRHLWGRARIAAWVAGIERELAA